MLKSYKNLRRITEEVFNEDVRAVQAAKNKINDEYRKNRDLTDEKEILERVKMANDVGRELKQNVIQAVEKEPGKFGEFNFTALYL